MAHGVRDYKDRDRMSWVDLKETDADAQTGTIVQITESARQTDVNPDEKDQVR